MRERLGSVSASGLYASIPRSLSCLLCNGMGLRVWRCAGLQGFQGFGFVSERRTLFSALVQATNTTNEGTQLGGSMRMAIYQSDAFGLTAYLVASEQRSYRHPACIASTRILPIVGIRTNANCLYTHVPMLVCSRIS